MCLSVNVAAFYTYDVICFFFDGAMSFSFIFAAALFFSIFRASPCLNQICSFLIAFPSQSTDRVGKRAFLRGVVLCVLGSQMT